MILGMDWFAKYKGTIDCAQKAIKLILKDGTELNYAAEAPVTGKEAVNRVVLNQMEVSAAEEIRVIREFSDVFPKELPGMPPD